MIFYKAIKYTALQIFYNQQTNWSQVKFDTFYIWPKKINCSFWKNCPLIYHSKTKLFTLKASLKKHSFWMACIIFHIPIFYIFTGLFPTCSSLQKQTVVIWGTGHITVCSRPKYTATYIDIFRIYIQPLLIHWEVHLCQNGRSLQPPLQ